MIAQYPKISIITPSFNQGEYLEKTICSVIDQRYPNLEYIVIDGGSTDGSVDIIRKYMDKISYWVSEPDKGQVYAINKGIKIATGEWIGWQNSDDIYYPDALHDLAIEAKERPDIDIIVGNMNIIDKRNRILRDVKYVRPTYRSMLAEGMVMCNQAAFWRRRVHDSVGYMDETLNYNFDFDWFLRLLKRRRARFVNKTWGALRYHEDTKTNNQQVKFLEENRIILKDRNSSIISKRIYQLRRLAIMISRGEFRYIVRGAMDRIRLSLGI